MRLIVIKLVLDGGHGEVLQLLKLNSGRAVVAGWDDSCSVIMGNAPHLHDFGLDLLSH